jgi:hypothetical protein
MSNQPEKSVARAIKRSLVRILGLLFFLLCVDGCVYRDPYIQLPHGYGIGSISNSTPCSLEYGRQDDRTYSTWIAADVSGCKTDGVATPSYSLMNMTTDEYLAFDDESVWRAAIRNHNVKPSQSWIPDVANIRRFNTREAFVFGDCEPGYFVLNIEENDVTIIPDEATWRSEVARLTGEPRGWMWSANSFLLKYRDPEYLAFMGILTLTCLIMIFRRRNIPIGQREA